MPVGGLYGRAASCLGSIAGTSNPRAADADASRDRVIAFAHCPTRAPRFFGPTTGRLLSNLKQARIDPKDIDAVVMTHAHVEHLGGNNADNGTSNFPNAQLYIDSRLRPLD
jgi:glyoxylase-like metal-dependent hydrolase (beta-lactamase superfamily II)